MATLAPVTCPEDMALGRVWLASLHGSPADLPFSFVYGGRRIRGLPPEWSPSTSEARIDANIIQTVHQATDAATGLQVRVEVLEYRDFAAAEWLIWFTNASGAPTPIISDVQAIDATFSGASPVIEHCNGDYYSEEGYTPQETPLPDDAELAFAPNGGRPCDGAFPYFRVRFEGCGLTLAVGWPGQWAATFIGLADGVSVRAGQERIHLRLRPGETIRTPRMTALAWTGDTTRAINVWRRWYLAHVLPRPDGQPLQPQLAVAATDTGEEFTAATEANQLAYMDRFGDAGFDFDVWWIDAGWYPCRDADGDRRWPITGSWRPDPERFPNGFAPVSARTREHGARLLVWFEPERVHEGTELWREHPGWLLRANTSDGERDPNALLNLGDPECRQWLTDRVCDLIQRGGIGIYRQDFNFPPLAYWRDSESEDRQGLNENLHVQGYLRYWDDLLARNPGLWIDSCSSGGRRNDLETMRRSVPLHYTDYGYGIHPVKLSFHQLMYAWIPYFKECTLSWDQNQPGDDGRFDRVIDGFSFHCGMAAMMFATIDIRRDDYDFALGRQMIALWRRAADLLTYGDYYPLTPFDRSGEQWVAWQFDDPDAGEGFVQAIRLAACDEESLTIRLKALDPAPEYVLDNPETGEELRMAGSALLADGMTVSLPAREAGIWFYRRV